MMKIVTLLFLSSVTIAGAFQPLNAPMPRISTCIEAVKPQKSASKKKKSNSSWMENFFNFQPFHGHGSGEHEEQVMFDEQQSVLKARRKTMSNLRNKYQKDPTLDHLKDIAVHQHDPAALNQKEDDAMYFTKEEEEGTGFSLPFFNKKSKLQP